MEPPAAAQRRGGTTLTPTSGWRPSPVRKPHPRSETPAQSFSSSAATSAVSTRAPADTLATLANHSARRRVATTARIRRSVSGQPEHASPGGTRPSRRGSRIWRRPTCPALSVAVAARGLPTGTCSVAQDALTTLGIDLATATMADSRRLALVLRHSAGRQALGKLVMSVNSFEDTTTIWEAATALDMPWGWSTRYARSGGWPTCGQGGSASADCGGVARGALTGNRQKPPADVKTRAVLSRYEDL